MRVNSDTNLTGPGIIGQTNTTLGGHNIKTSSAQTNQSIQGIKKKFNMLETPSLNMRNVKQSMIGEHERKNTQSSSPSAGSAAPSSTAPASQNTPISSSSTLGESSAAVSPQLAPAQPPASQTAPSPTLSASPAPSTHQTNGTQSSSPSAGSAATSLTGTTPQNTPISSSDTPSSASSSVPPPPAQPPASQTAPSPTPPATTLSVGGGVPSGQPQKVGSGFPQLSGSPKEIRNKLREDLILLVTDSKAKKEFKKLLTLEGIFFEVHYNGRISEKLQRAILEDIIPKLLGDQKQLAFLLAFLCNYSNDKELRGKIPKKDIKNLTIEKAFTNQTLMPYISRAFESQNNSLLKEGNFSQLEQTSITLPAGVTINGAQSITIQKLANELKTEIMPNTNSTDQDKWNTISLRAENRDDLSGRGQSLISTIEDAKLLAIYCMMSNEAADLILHLVLNGTNQYSGSAQSPFLTTQKLESLAKDNWFLSPTGETPKAMTDFFNAITGSNSTTEDIKQKTVSLIGTFNHQKGVSTNSLEGFSIAKPNAAADPEPTPVPTSTSDNTDKNLIRKIKAKLRRRSTSTP